MCLVFFLCFFASLDKVGLVVAHSHGGEMDLAACALREYETPCQLPPSSPSLSSYAASSMNAAPAPSPVILLGAAGTPPPSLPSPTAGLAAGDSGGAQPVQGAAMLLLTQSSVPPLAGFIDGAQTRGSRGSGVPPLPRLENVVVVGGASFAAVSPSLTQSSRRNANASVTSQLFDCSPNDDLPLDMHLASRSPSCMLTASLSAVAVSPTRGAPVRGVAAQEVGCVLLGPGHATDCAICLWSREDADPAHPAPHPVSAASTPNAAAQTDPPPESVKLSCNHEFHADCLQRWLLTSRLCPMCRQEVAPSTETWPPPTTSSPAEGGRVVPAAAYGGGEANEQERK
ncbi:uncharacterized protein Tco025E_03121 [Trypanosoma conorhini]|uniref:RING-type domain-containing protein n=1 Tax=Trypanosoma conorhini TaxID=83891 RepID=A0A3R7NSI7_9TRYP|nr:uncharacterized protein Tco025E_03121 [Trypanosoma conorhini]RNF22806.1 hypothetical protein Tco025E_03121 [Trypanosoma conorhini]